MKTILFIHTLLLWLSKNIISARILPEYNWNPSCDFRDSVNITSGTKFANLSYLHDGILYPLNLIGVYNYELVNLTVKVLVEPHLRGCICKIKTCTRMCCENFMAYDSNTAECYKPKRDFSSLVNITETSGAYRNADIKSLFGFVYGRPCELAYFLDPQGYSYDEWNLFANGTIERPDDNAYFTKDEYCLSPTLSVNDTLMQLNPFVCSKQENAQRYTIYGAAVFVSVPFMIITFIIYAIIPELRNLHGKSLCCYLLSLSLGYSCLGYILLSGGVDTGKIECKILGSLTYYSFMAGFLWLNVISFDLWWNFRSVSSRESKSQWKRFIYYSTYSWGLALVFLIMVLVLQDSNIPEESKPGIGGGDNCFLNLHTWLQLFYFYGQLLVTISFNTVVFVLTLMTIHRVNKEMSTMMAKGESRKSYNREKAKIMLFLRLFIIMGVTWSFEFISWISGQKYEFLFRVSDIFNAIQGLLIFIFFVLRKRVKTLLIQRYNSMRGIRRKESMTVTQTTKSSDIPMVATNMNGRKSHEEYRKVEEPLMSTMSDDESHTYN